MRHEGRFFEDTTITIDGDDYEDCVFTRCTIEYSGGKVTLTNNHFHDCFWLFCGPAANVIVIMRMLYQQDGENVIHRMLSETE